MSVKGWPPRNGVTTVYTGGTFDLLHPGHIDLLKVCRKVAGPDGRVMVALNRDGFVEMFKGARPVCTYVERKAMLDGCRFVDEVVENSGDQDSTVTIEQVQPDYILIGDDWATRDYFKQMGFSQNWLDERGITLLYVPRHCNISSTDIKARTVGANGQLAARPLPT